MITPKSIFKFFVLLFLTLSLCSCASFGKKLKAFLSGDKGTTKTSSKSKAPKAGTSYNQQANFLRGPTRSYKRMTKKEFENSSSLESNSGSLWAMEGQGAYLFSQNIMRMIGDPIAIKIEGDAKEQLESKSKVISKLLKKLEARKAALRNRRVAGLKGKKGAQKVGQSQPKKEPEKEEKSEGKDGKGKKLFKVKTVPSRIVERMVDGNYRIKGNQIFIIGTREYKTIVTGIVRAEDFSEDGMSSSELIDPRFDIVSTRKKEIR